MQDTQRFARFLADGHEHTRLVGEVLSARGFTVNVPDSVLRAHVDERFAFQQEVDLLVGRPCTVSGHTHRADEPMPMPLEVKSRTQRFTCARDFPFRTAIVDTVRGWDRKSPKPPAVICVSQHTKAMFVARTRTSDRWTREWHWDRQRRINEEFYECPRSDLQEFDDFIADLRDRLGECRM